jgi:RimJ/RimL family protein N-acetyltransferase
MNDLAARRRALRHLLDERSPTDAIASYYALHHPDAKTQLLTIPTDADRAAGYVAISRTGMDLFRPLVTLRLPLADMAASRDLIHQALLPKTAVILIAPLSYRPLLHALFEIQVEEQLRLFTLDRSRFEPIINLLVTQTTGPNDLPRFIIRNNNSREREVVASAGLNWQSPTFAEISVNTRPEHRRRGWGRSVVAAMVQHVLGNGRSPLYIVSEHNSPSLQLAQQVGFVDSRIRLLLLQAVLRPRTIS